MVQTRIMARSPSCRRCAWKKRCVAIGSFLQRGACSERARLSARLSAKLSARLRIPPDFPADGSGVAWRSSAHPEAATRPTPVTPDRAGARLWGEPLRALQPIPVCRPVCRPVCLSAGQNHAGAGTLSTATGKPGLSLPCDGQGPSTAVRCISRRLSFSKYAYVLPNGPQGANYSIAKLGG